MRTLPNMFELCGDLYEGRHGCAYRLSFLWGEALSSIVLQQVEGSTATWVVDPLG